MASPKHHILVEEMNGGNEHLTLPWKESVRLTMVNQESVFKYQLKELHRVYTKQVELMEGHEGTVIGSKKRSKKPKFDHGDEPVNLTDLIEVHDANAPATPETTNSSTARGKQAVREEEHARSAAEALVAMSSSYLRASGHLLLWFAKIVTSIKRNADLAFVQRRTRGQKPGQHGKERLQRTQMPGQHCAKKRKGTHVEPCVSNWGKIKNGQRSKRVRGSNPLYTFQRGAVLCRWR